MREYRILDGQKTPVEDQIGFDVRPYLTKVSFKPGEHLFREGGRAEYLYYLDQGRAKVMRTEENGRETLSNFLDAPAFTGEMELLGARENTTAVIAVTRCVCYRIRCTHCKEQLLNDAKFLRSLCTDLFSRFVREADNFSRNLSYPLDMRLARFILLSSADNLYREKHTEAAAYLGVSYRHLLYVLSGFVREGLLEKTEQGYRIADPEGLKAHSVPSA